MRKKISVDEYMKEEEHADSSDDDYVDSYDDDHADSSYEDMPAHQDAKAKPISIPYLPNQT